MESEDQDQGLTSFNISEAELIGLQQAGLEGQDSAEHLSQGDLEALASIQVAQKYIDLSHSLTFLPTG